MHHVVPQCTKYKSVISLIYLFSISGLHVVLKVQNIFVECTIKCFKALISIYFNNKIVLKNYVYLVRPSGCGLCLHTCRSKEVYNFEKCGDIKTRRVLMQKKKKKKKKN